jgi:hypothetical protein
LLPRVPAERAPAADEHSRIPVERAEPADRSVQVDPGSPPPERTETGAPPSRFLRPEMVTAMRTMAKESPAVQTPPARPAPDQIEIHIGRIEVMAVPPAAPAPPPKRERKTMNLDEYLKRSEGRRR